ncbi:DEAD/DEAH box helicase [Actomonas aquatica]|uniref:DEAD/DEAH box helicase n=1 Tax=Actomonas aquatica TaxID=2866162 RepID=A0ABZ1CDR2_9BACT|nr:DEAD/DEAH box helicase [Opitutus sp. WL0086]WRQ89800.1 DEAD/DEAH box helicase [Opitutus sp. WL0086]
MARFGSDDWAAGLQRLMLPDAWQAEAIQALAAGEDVVVDAPTGAGKTYVFERWAEQANFGRRAIFTVPTRALANDKYAEWRERGWRVGIVTGDVTVDPEAPVVVATLEAVQRELTAIGATGESRLLVVDEYQWIADPVRGNHYEGVLLALPVTVQLLLLSGSVGNPGDVQAWLQRLGRSVRMVRTRVRPVPLEEFDVDDLTRGLPREIQGFWAKRLAGALREGLGPVLVFAPHRRDAERLARQFAREVPLSEPLTLTTAQEQAAGPQLARLLRQRVAYHHSGLSYLQRAGVVEPLAKAGQLRAVVATLGLSAGINFSLRSVMVTAERYRVGHVERPIAPHELLQMIGRAGRRGLDEVGYMLVSLRTPRMGRAAPQRLKRATPMPWTFLLRGLRVGDDAAQLVRDWGARFYAPEPIAVGNEVTGQLPAEVTLPCAQKTDTGRARVVRRRRNPFRGCRGCEWRRECLALSPQPTLLWSLQRLGVLDKQLRLTARGAIVASFTGPEGLALAAALESPRYPLDDLLYDAANLFAGERFCGDDPQRIGRLLQVAEKVYRRFDFPGFLSEGVPTGYGAGASEVVQALTERTAKASTVIAELEQAGRGDVDRLLTEWRSLLRQVAHAAPLDGDGLSPAELKLAERWDVFRGLCRATLDAQGRTTLPEVPPLSAEQRKPIEHRFRRLRPGEGLTRQAAAG